MKRASSRRSRRRQQAAGAAGRDLENLENLDTMDEALTDFTIDELREFLEADLVDVPMDPGFKERLRERLWALVQERAEGAGPRRPDDD